MSLNPAGAFYNFYLTINCLNRSGENIVTYENSKPVKVFRWKCNSIHKYRQMYIVLSSALKRRGLYTIWQRGQFSAYINCILIGHLSISMWIKLHYYPNDFTTYIPKNIFFTFFVKVNFIKAPAGFVLMSYRFVVNALPLYATLLGNNFGKENSYIYCL